MSTEEIKQLQDTHNAYGKRIEELETADGGKKKRRKDPNPNRRGKAINVATKKKK